MIWIAVLLIGIAVSDLVRSVWPVTIVPACAGGAALVGVGALAGLSEAADVTALVLGAAAVVGWGLANDRVLGASADRRTAAVPLGVLGLALSLAVLFSPYAGSAGGMVQEWLDATTLPALHDLSADRALLVLGALGVQLSSGNTIVRLVLTATGTLDPSRAVPRVRDATDELKGGRLLGPMERIFILGLGLAGHVTAASIVVAAKGLVRFPELQSKRAQQAARTTASAGPDIDEVTEYFLVGSFVSWLVSLACLVLLAR